MTKRSCQHNSRISGSTVYAACRTEADRSGDQFALCGYDDCHAVFHFSPTFDRAHQDMALIPYFEAQRSHIEWRQNCIRKYRVSAFGKTRGAVLAIGAGAGHSIKVTSDRGWRDWGNQLVRTLIELHMRLHPYKVFMPNRLHHSKVLNYSFARMLGFATGYYVITRATKSV
jgi:hypothetical protein